MAEPATGNMKTERPIGSTVRFFLLLALGAWLIRSLVVAPFSIPSGSMLPTMAIGDYLFVAKWPYGYSRYSFPFQLPSFDGRILSGMPQRGDVVIFQKPGEDADWVKRVIGLPGDTIAAEDGRLFINGRLVPRTGEGTIGVPVSPNSGTRSFCVDDGGTVMYGGDPNSNPPMLGTTANAMAVMRTLVERYGAAPRAFLVAPLVGAFFIDFTNALIITGFINLWPH